jgi:hypothetical protein
MTRRRGLQRGVRVLVVLLAFVLAITAVAAATPAGSALVVEDASSGERLLTAPAGEGTTVALNYTHSVEKTPVHDIYTVHNGSLEMTRMEFQSYGWGLPSRANVSRENGWYVFDPPGDYEELYVEPGRVAGHRLRVGDRTYDLVERSNAEGVRLHITERSVLRTVLDRIN